MLNSMVSPYHGIDLEGWEAKTQELVSVHPLDSDEIVKVVLKVWDDIFASRIGTKPFLIGTHILPSPQIMAFFLHELISLELASRYPGVWRGDISANEKDLVYIPDEVYSVEIKASSSGGQIFGNRSYAQPGKTSKKSKSGYYLGVNFQKFVAGGTPPRITRIRFGWLDLTDWLGQQAATGQQARLNKEADRRKMLLLYQLSVEK